VPIGLNYDEELTARTREAGAGEVKLVGELASRRLAMDKAAVLEAKGGERPRLLLLGMAQVRMGRSKSSNDLVLRVLPRSESNDSLSLQITGRRPHCILSLKPDGLFLADRDTANGTYLNGKAVKGEALVPLDQASEVDVAKALRLRLVPFLEAEEEGEGAEARYAKLGEPDEVWQTAERLRLRSLLIQREDNLTKEERYLVTYRWIEIGSGAGNEVILPGASLSRTHMRIVRFGGQFWLESLVDKNRLTADGVGVPRGHACPLVPGMKLAYGDLLGEFAEFQQYGL
jgi:pSer/pThr/pTyr-binding forkhead associated (FHA) protein